MHRKALDYGKPMYAQQPRLPMLPVPSLEATRNKYLRSVQALGASPAHVALADSFFASAQAQQLQQRLQQRAHTMQTEGKSWLIDWWNDYAYMAYRDPVVFYVSYFFHFRDDPFRRTQSLRAAAIIRAVMQFRQHWINQELEPDWAGKNGAPASYPLCMNQYQYMFHSCRVPRPSSDTTHQYDPALFNHVLVIRKGKFYAIHPTIATSKGDTLLDEHALASLLDTVKHMADRDGFDPHPVGALSSADRDTYADTLAQLLSVSPVNNQRALEMIESSAFAICLDDTAPLTRAEVGRALWHGDGKNRWYDKTLQFIVFENGKAGFLGEHSQLDATPNHRMCEFVLNATLRHPPSSTPSSPLAEQKPLEIKFELSDTTRTHISQAISQFQHHVDKHDHHVLYYPGFGKNLIKQHRLSPDAFVQIAIQLAYYKLFGTCRPTYESAQTKKFKMGRTETCRSVSLESVAFCTAMQDPSVHVSTKATLLRQAIKTHSAYMADCLLGQGIDRHLLGLKLSLDPSEPMPALFQDPTFKNASYWYISTSQVSSELYDGWGWGEVVPEGYGVAYMINSASLSFNLASLKGGPGRDNGLLSRADGGAAENKGLEHACEKMAHVLVESLEEMREVLDGVSNGDSSKKAKL